MFSSMLSLLGSLRGGSSFITNSLRFRSSASAYLSRTFPATPTTYTLSFWLKRGSLGSIQVPFGSRLSGTGASTIIFTASDTIEIGFNNITRITTASVYRDTSAWYHFVVSVTNNGNVVFYSNGNQVGSAAAGSNPFLFNSAWTNAIGRNGDANTQYFDGYLADINFIDGQALTPASFGAIDSSTGVWAPRPYSGTYGTNGFYLKFANTSSVAALGNDSSGNNNTWTVNNVSLTAGATYDSMIDVPVNYSDGGNGRGNYAVLSPLDKTASLSVTNANLTASFSTTNQVCFSTFGVSNGKWYWEVNPSTTVEDMIGVANASATRTGYTGSDANGWSYYKTNGNKYNNATGTAYGATYANTDIIGVALDMDAGTLTFYKNNVSQGAAFTGLTGTLFPTLSTAGTGAAQSINFGQRPFQNTTAWATLQAAGFRALNTNNLPTPSIVNGANFMAATTYTGNAAARSLSNAVNSVSFQPDLVWIKSRTPGATNHALFDSTRGTTKYLSSNTTTAETTLAQSLTAFGADGFSLGTDTTLVNANANSYVAWQWKAGGAAVSNTQGTITSQVSANTTAGFSVVTYTGTGVNATVGHGLGVAPKMVIIKRRGTAGFGWIVGHTSIGWGNILYLNAINGSSSAAAVFQSTAPSSSIVTLGTDTYVNDSTAGNTYVAYCFAEIAGFSRFGSYTGNGSADGPFVFCGFRPRWVMIKETGNPQDWIIHDTGRAAYNADDLRLLANLPGTELNTGFPIDELSNGFKIRNAGNGSNRPGGTYIFAAFAEVPSKYALAR